VQVWRDGLGSPYALCFASNCALTIVPDVASYSLETRAGRVTAAGFSAVPSAVIEEAFNRIVLPLMLQFSGLEVLHGSAVLTSAGVVAWCGPSGTGKSTIGFGLSRLGYRLWADDAVSVDLSRKYPVSVSLPYEPRLRKGAAQFFAGGWRRSNVTRAHELPKSNEVAWAPMVAVCLLKRMDCGNGTLGVRELSGAAAVTALLDNAFCFSLHDDRRKRLMLEQYMQLAVHVPLLEVRFREGLDVLPRVLDEICDLLEAVTHGKVHRSA
jgi:hypothetical protein